MPRRGVDSHGRKAITYKINCPPIPSQNIFGKQTMPRRGVDCRRGHLNNYEVSYGWEGRTFGDFASSLAISSAGSIGDA